ncbi:MAG: UDP-glucose 4-epimerase GalE [Oscillibacter sp.]|nr:UDP-glucose 4-epimerase GalE [Oscillibacter sp.]
MNILVTGGAGYIGSHTCVELLNADHQVVIYDNLYNAKSAVMDRISHITGKDVCFVRGDILDEKALDAVFTQHPIDAVIHFAGLKAVGESVEKPLLYYENNVSGTIALCKAMARAGCKKMIFSSSATVYRMRMEPPFPAFTEDMPLGPINPYGATKRMIEQILTDLAASDKEWSVALLRYFNPIGAHESGLLGEDPQGIPNNLLPYVMRVAVGKLPCLQIFGDDYPTPDGTGVRDYIHVADLAKGHLAALRALESGGARPYNLGTGRGYSVKDVVAAFSRACGHEIPCRVAPRRAGDAPWYYADATRAKEELGWTAQYDLDRMCEDAWRFIRANPDGIR